jgi:predicted PurR-regulated permease PerM
MSRWISFIVLFGVLVIIGAFFVRVMAEFLVPLFVALLLVVIFRPIHVWLLSRLPERPALAALLTTVGVCLLVFLPLVVMIVMAAAEGREIVKRFDRAVLVQKLSDFRSSMGLNFPHADRLGELERELTDARSSLDEGTRGPLGLSPRMIDEIQRDLLREFLTQVESHSQALGTAVQVRWPELSPPPPSPSAAETPTPPDGLSDTAIPAIVEAAAAADDSAVTAVDAPPDADTPLAATTQDQDQNNDQDQDSESFFGLTLPGFARESTEDPQALRPTGSSPLEQQWFNYVFQLQDTQRLLDHPGWNESPARVRELEVQLRALLANSHTNFREFKVRLLGGPLMAWLREVVNPQEEEIDQYTAGLLDFAKQNFVSWGSLISLYLGRLLFGLTIVVVALYFFLLDGPRMVEAVTQISPLDNRHERELIAQFDRTSRAVVVATLAAALVQGLLAGVGFYFAGIQSIFLLTMLTMLLAMIPFLGAASVWVPVVAYLALFENRLAAAMILFLYCALIVSTIDNVIKPYILHGQSNLHPLLALLSVIGGVTALGPIGIMLGPMLVVFLQTLLKMLKNELMALDTNRGTEPSPSPTVSM